MTKEQYQDFCLRYKGCGACFPIYEKLTRFEKMWFTTIQKDIADLEKENTGLKLKLEALEGETPWKDIKDKSEVIGQLTEAKELIKNIIRVTWGEGWSYSLDWKVKAETFIEK